MRSRLCSTEGSPGSRPARSAQRARAGRHAFRSDSRGSDDVMTAPFTVLLLTTAVYALLGVTVWRSQPTGVANCAFAYLAFIFRARRPPRATLVPYATLLQ